MIFRKKEPLNQQEIQNVFDELEFSLALLESPVFKVIPIRISLQKKDDRFSGLIVKYKEIIAFIPREELKHFCYKLGNAEKLVSERIPLDVYFKKFQEGKNLLAPWQWQTPIFTMLYPD